MVQRFRNGGLHLIFRIRRESRADAQMARSKWVTLRSKGPSHGVMYPPLTLFRHFGEGFRVSAPRVTYELVDSYRDARAIEFGT
jgi:hypothetical protein